MAKHQRNASKGKPITSHPLFPAVVALWFGALFGLGSLAVRASLLEGLVVSSRIDLIVPAAAPPLGVTARMLVALVLAALGAVLGAMIARRINRPKPEAYQRKRDARTARDEDYSVRTLDPDAPEQGPVAVSYGEGADYEDDVAALSQRRRPLAIEHEEVAYVPHEMAPLPGSQPQILDIAGMNLGEPMGGVEAAAPAVFAESDFADHAPAGLEDSSDERGIAAFAAPHEAPLDLAGFAQSDSAQPEPAQPESIQPEPVAAPALDWSQAKPVAADPATAFARPAPGMIEQQRQMFQPVEPETPAFAAQAPEAPSALSSERQVFGQLSADAFSNEAIPAETYAPDQAEPATPAADGRQMFGQNAPDDHVPSEYVESLGYRTSVFAQPEVQPLFPARPEAAEPAPEPISAAIAQAAPVQEELEPLPNPATLGMTELAQRLADSMRRRRAARAAAFDAPAGDAQAEPEIAVPPPYVPPFAHIDPIDEPIPAPFARLGASAAEAAPEALEVLADQADAEDPFEITVDVIETAPEPAFTVPPAPVAMPAALRPINFDDFANDESDPMLDSLLPPRGLSDALLPQDEQAATAAAEPETAEVEAEPEAVAAEQDYGSLLDLGAAALRNPFVRIEEPDSAGDSIEPVVIFPGQAMRTETVTPLAPRQVPLGEDDPAPFRRFDAPGQAEPGQNPQTDPDEAERALRAALANLQRISGAA